MGNVRLGRQERKEQTRGLLIDAAAAVFARRGFAAASLDEVAEAAGFTKGAVYSNFRSKTDLMRSIIERRVGEQAVAAAREMAGATLDEVIARLASAPTFESAPQADWLLLMAEFWQYAMRDAQARVAMADQYERARTISAGMIAQKYAEAGRQPPLPARDLAILMEALSVGLGFQAALDPEAVPARLLAEAARRLLAPDQDPDRAESGDPALP